jgi:hypothetical protein
VAEATARDQAWLERVRAGMVALLGFFDDEPKWARLLVAEPPVSGAVALECRQRLHSVLAGLLETNGDVRVTEGHTDCPAHGAARLPSALAGELVLGGVLSVIRTSIREGDESKLVELAPSLMAFIVAPYLGEAAARGELDGHSSVGEQPPIGDDNSLRAVPTSRAAGRSPAGGRSRAAELWRAAELPVRATHRTTLVLCAIARAPYSNNREVAHAAGLADEGQTSKLLARLERRGVIENVGIGAARGEPNAWLLTALGRRAVELLGESSTGETRRPLGARTRGMT